MTALDALPVGTHTDHRIQLEAVYWCFAGISTIFIALRVGARISKRMLGADDWLMVACWLSFIATGALLTFIAESGGTRHKAALTIPELEYQIKLQTINLVFWIATTLFGKMSIGLTILRILDRTNKWHTWPVYLMMHLMTITCVLDTFLVLFRCGSPSSLWNLREPSRCLDEGVVHRFNVFAAAWQVFVDFFLAFFPMYIISGLQMPRRRKYTIMALLGLTTLTGAAASVKTAVSQASLGEADRDPTWDMYVLSMWTATEVMLLIVFGSVPVMAHLWDSRSRSRNRGYDYDASNYAGGGPSGGRYSRAGWPKDPEKAQRKFDVESDDLENLDPEDTSELVRVSPKAVLAELPSVPHTRSSLGRPLFATKQGIADRVSGRWHHLGEKSWGRGEDEGTSDRRCSDSVV